MSRTLSPSSGKPYGLARVCRVWRASRASVYRHLSSPGPNRPGVLARSGRCRMPHWWRRSARS